MRFFSRRHMKKNKMKWKKYLRLARPVTHRHERNKRLDPADPTQSERDPVGLVHVHNPSDTTLSRQLQELALLERMPAVGWYDHSSNSLQMHTKTASRRYLRMDPGDPFLPSSEPIDVFPDGGVVDAPSVVTTNLATYRANRAAGRSVVFRPSLLAHLGVSGGPRNGILVVDEGDIPSSILDAVVSAVRAPVTYTSVKVVSGEPFHTRLQRAKALVSAINHAQAVISNDRDVALIAMFTGALSVVITSDVAPFSDSAFSQNMLLLSPALEVDRSFGELLARIRNNEAIDALTTVRIVQERLRALPLTGQLSQPGVAIVAACMNRNAHLRISIETWLATSAKQIVLVDWNSSTPVAETISDLLPNPRILVLRVTNVQKWILARALNIGIRSALFEEILKVDADTLVAPSFFDRHVLGNRPIFFSGNWRIARDENEMHTNGVVFFRKLDFVAANGYNELLTTYGYDDTDLYERMERFVTRADIDLETVEHIPHSDEARVANQTLVSDLGVEIERNRLICLKFQWGPSYQQSMTVVNPRENIYRCEIVRSNIITEEQRDICLQQARINRGVRVRRLYAQVMCGLCNRLRALASLHTIAGNAGCEFVLLWTIDMHCEARFDQLYEWTGLVFHDMSVVDAGTVPVIVSETSAAPRDTTPDAPEILAMDDIDHALDLLAADLIATSSHVVDSRFRTWEEEDTFLCHLQPIPSVQAVIDRVLRGWDAKSAIGIHIRSGQDSATHPCEDTSKYTEDARDAIAAWRRVSTAEVFATEMRRWLLLYPAQVFYVATDMQTTLDSLLEEFGSEHIKHCARTHFDRSSMQLQEAVVDLYILGKTGAIWGSNWSSFTEVAYRIAGVKPRLAGVDF